MDVLSTILGVLFRWIHIGSAIVLVGGAVYLRWIVMPSAAELPDAEHEALRGRLKARWKGIVILGILLLLVSGFYNYLKVTAPAHKGIPLYHILMGIKILLALAVFFLASVMTGRSAKFEPMRQRPQLWLTLQITLAAIVVALGGLLKVALPGN